MPVQKTTPLLRSERDLCYNFRDLYFSCLEKAGIEDPTRVEEDNELRKKAEAFGCLKKNDQYKRACPSSWVSMREGLEYVPRMEGMEIVYVRERVYICVVTECGCGCGLRDLIKLEQSSCLGEIF